ncbi:hypothetical protein [Kitasatospora sp. NPDC093558]|uniref:hypothetical protein n=1 Tax=Kitasatospora sp. NPDC093558 TaxID=3155201 RepID=UPI0034266155
MPEDRDRATVGEIRAALGGDCAWVTRRLLKAQVRQFPTRADVAAWQQAAPEWFVREKERRERRQARQQAEKVTITCPGCGFSIKVKPRTARERENWEALYCGRNACDYEPPDSPGMITVIGINAVGSFTGWRHEFPDERQAASLDRARMLALAALARQSGSPIQAAIGNLVAPAGPGRHLLHFDDWSTAVDLAADGTIEIENPMVAAALHRMVQEGDEVGVILRTFLEEVSHTGPNGVGIPVKEVRGWYLAEGVFHPLTEAEIFSAYCTDADTGEPLPPERGVRYVDAYTVGF